MNNKILLSTDIGSDPDDALSLDVMLNANLNLQGVYTVNGNVIARSFITKEIISRSKKNITIGVGESESFNKMRTPYTYGEELLVSEKYIDPEELKNVVFLPVEKFGIIRNGVANMAQKLSKEKYTIFSIAPLTNIAKLIQDYPQTIKNIEELYIMGCRFQKDSLEHNIHFDVEAAHLVLDSEIPITIIPGDVCTPYHMPLEYLNQLTTEHGAYVKQTALAYIAMKIAKTIAISPASKFEELKDIIHKSEHNHSTDLYKFMLHDTIITNAQHIQSIPNNEQEEAINQKKHLVTNLNDTVFAAMYPEEYLSTYNKCIKHFLESPFEYSYKQEVAKILTRIQEKEKDFSVADVYIPYCFMNQDKLKTIEGTVKLDYPFGKSVISEGKKHKIVTDIDYNDFDQYIKKYLK